MKKALFILLAVVVLGAVVIGCSSQTTSTTPASSTTSSTTAATTPAATLTIKFGTDLPPTLAPVVGLHWWADEVTKETQGRVTVQMYPASSLSDQASALDNVLAGVADMYYLSIGSHRQSFPITSITGMPGVGFPDDTLEANTAHMNTFFDLLQKYPAAAAEFKDFGPVFFYIIYSESYMISKGKQVRLPADVKGMKVGCNGIRMDLMSQVGAVPVNDIPPTAYEKLQTGVEQATFTAISAVHDFQLYEVSDYALNVPFGGGGMACVINKDTWNKISPQDQKIMKDLALQGSQRSHQALADLNTLSWKEVTDKGMTTTATVEEEAAWDGTFQPIWDSWISQNEAAGISNARDIFNFWKAAADKAWVK